MFITLIYLKILKAIRAVLVVRVSAGKEGIAVTFVNPIEMDYIRQIEDANGRKMSALRPPHRKEVLQAREDDIKEKVENWMSKE